MSCKLEVCVTKSISFVFKHTHTVLTCSIANTGLVDSMHTLGALCHYIHCF